VIPEYTDHTIQLSSGLSIALEIRAQNAVETFRQTAGPWDVDMAKELRPDTIRALYGMNRILNAIHCTDLPEDAELECEYCFKLL
jgi:nucleoside-diphosphate kinase